MSKIKVLVVDDSAVVRQTLSSVLSSDPLIEVIGTAQDPVFAAEKMRVQKPDVITLDVEMPRMDGLTFLQKLMQQHPIPVVICSSLVDEGSETLAKAIEYGAAEIITKPTSGTAAFIQDQTITICDAVKAAALVNVSKLRRTKSAPQPKLNADVVIAQNKRAMVKTTDQIIVVGASTGGTEAITTFLQALPSDCPGIVIVQHMPEGFTRSFAERLNTLTCLDVKEAENGDSVLRGHVLIAPGSSHLLCKRSGARYYVEVKDGPLVSRHRPSVDVLFRSAAQFAGKNAIGIIMTGMGDDGAKGMKELHDAGAFTMAQDEKSSVVFGMPNEAIKLGGISKIVPLDRLASRLLGHLSRF